MQVDKHVSFVMILYFIVSFVGFRYEAMRQLEASGEYFSDEEMKRRDPLLYEDMVGQYLTDDDAKAMLAVDERMKHHALSEVLLQRIQATQNNQLYEQLKVAEVFTHIGNSDDCQNCRLIVLAE